MAAPMKKGTLIRVVADQLTNSLEAQASDSRLPGYLLETTGEILDVKGDYALVRFPVPTPNVWLKLEQLEAAA